MNTVMRLNLCKPPCCDTRVDLFQKDRTCGIDELLVSSFLLSIHQYSLRRHSPDKMFKIIVAVSLLLTGFAQSDLAVTEPSSDHWCKSPVLIAFLLSFLFGDSSIALLGGVLMIQGSLTRSTPFAGRETPQLNSRSS